MLSCEWVYKAMVLALSVVVRSICIKLTAIYGDIAGGLPTWALRIIRVQGKSATLPRKIACFFGMQCMRDAATNECPERSLSWLSHKVGQLTSYS